MATNGLYHNFFIIALYLKENTTTVNAGYLQVKELARINRHTCMLCRIISLQQQQSSWLSFPPCDVENHCLISWVIGC